MIDNKTYNALATAAHDNAVRHGFYTTTPSNEHLLALIVTEIAEAVQADRNATQVESARDRYETMCQNGIDDDVAFEVAVKGTVMDELADVCIRLLDMAGFKGMDFEKMTPCRYIRTFDKYSFTENAFGLMKGLCRESFSIERRIHFGLFYAQEWCYSMNESIEWYIRQKMEYNKTRERMHGKKY